MSSTCKAAALLLSHGCVRWVSQERESSVSMAMAAASARREVVLWCVSLSAATTAAPARREYTHLQFLPPLEFSSSFAACTLSTLSSMNSVIRETQQDDWCCEQNQFSSVARSCPTLCDPANRAARQASLSITNSRSPLKPMSIESVMPSNHLILCRPLLLLPSIFPSIRVFSNESALRIRWPKYWTFSFNIGPSNEHSGLISFRMDWLDLLAV